MTSLHILAADSVYAPLSASFQENNQDESFVQTPAADSVYASGFPANNEDDPFMQIST